MLFVALTSWKCAFDCEIAIIFDAIWELEVKAADNQNLLINTARFTRMVPEFFAWLTAGTRDAVQMAVC